MATEINTSLTLTVVGFNPEDITSFVGIEPTDTWRVGYQPREGAAKRKFDGWSISTGKKPSINLDEQLLDLLKIIQPCRLKLVQICKKFNLEVEFDCVIYIKGNDIPSIHIDNSVVKLAAELNAEIDVDLYIRD